MAVHHLAVTVWIDVNAETASDARRRGYQYVRESLAADHRLKLVDMKHPRERSKATPLIVSYGAVPSLCGCGQAECKVCRPGKDGQ